MNRREEQTKDETTEDTDTRPESLGRVSTICPAPLDLPR